MGKKRTKRGSYRRVCPWDAPRLLQLIERLEAQPEAALTVPVERLVELTGIPISSCKRHVSWAKKYGILEVRAEYEGFGVGRPPNTYELKIGLEEWREIGESVVAAWAANAPREPVKRRVPKLSAPDVTASGGWFDVR